MMVVPTMPLVTQTGCERSSGKSRCSMAAKKQFWSERAMHRGHMGGGFCTGFIYSTMARCPLSSDLALIEENPA